MASTAIAQSTPVQVTRQPNIVVILADDLGYGDVGVYGNRVIKTPNIDLLAVDGVRFSQAYVSHPVCSPSRAGIMTGRNQVRHGWEFNPAGRDRAVGMSLDEVTLADRLRAQGYATALIGKWHLGETKPYHPMSRGFDEFFGVLSGGSVFVDSKTPGAQYGSIAGEPPPKMVSNRYRGYHKEMVTEHLTEAFTKEANGFIEREKGGPFFLFLSHTTPHTPLQATEEYLAEYRHIKDERTRVYAAMVASLDHSVGEVVKKLKELNILENTLVVFASDNGCAGYIRGACSNAPLSGHKRFHLEGGVRIPFIMRWAKKIPAATTYKSPVSALDLSATLVAAAGGDGVTQDSVDLLPYLNGRANGRPHEYLYWKSGPTVAIRNDRWKLLRLARLDPSIAKTKDVSGRLTVPEGGWPSSESMKVDSFLYDLSTDLAETTNVYTHYPDVVALLERQLDTWLAEVGTNEPILPPIRSRAARLHDNDYQLFF